MAERDMDRIIVPRAEDVLTSEEAQLLQAADRGERPCPNPRCGLPLRGERLIIPGVYEGIVLYCPPKRGGCGFREL
jgi:hypothetical protein